MISVNEKLISDRFKDYETKIINLEENAIKNLKKHIGWYIGLDQFQLDWVNDIIKFLSDNKTRLIDIDYENLQLMIQDIGEIPNGQKILTRTVNSRTGKKKKGKIIKRTFKDVIINALNYEDLKDKLFKDFFSKNDIKTCIYCNSQFTITIEKATTIYQSRFQFDHILPQESYPHLSISILNLVPCCSTCNNNKLAKKISFKPYQNNNELSSFKFKLNKGNLIDYFLNFEKDDLRIDFYDPQYNTGLQKESIEYNFHISKIYNEHKDIAEEIIIKAYIYTSSYISNLENDYKNILPRSKVPLNRLIMANYMEETELINRPMSKFTQDLFNEVQRLKIDIEKVLNPK